MALRSALRKMPVLGLRSPQPMMGPVRALSPAASSRLLSHDAAPAAEGTLAEQLESMELRRAEIDRKWAENERRAAAEFEGFMERTRQVMASGEQEMALAEAHYNEVTRRSSEDIARVMERVDIAGKTCTVLNVVFPAAAILVWIGVNM